MVKKTTNSTDDPKNKTAEQMSEYGYSVKMTPQQTSQQQTGSPQLKEVIDKLKSNPQAFEALKNALLKDQSIVKTKKQEVIEKTAKFTMANLQKSFASSLKNMDSFINYVVKKDGPNRNDALQQARSPILFGMWVAFFTFIVAGLWSGLAPLDSSSHATGFVISSTKKQIIQHREGGLLERMYVKEGAEVKAGQALVQLSDKVLKSQVEAAKAQKISTEKQLSLVTDQLVDLKKLYQEGFVPRDVIIRLQTREAELISVLSDLNARIINYEETFNRLLVTSPIDGTVNQIQFHTVGGVIPSGGTLMTIVPSKDELIVEAFVRPDDIDSVHVGLKAKIRVSAFKHRSVAPLEGVVTNISSDVVEPPQGHASQESMVLQHGLMYKVKISIDPDQLTKISKYRNYELLPGMMADVMIVTGERTMLQYIMDPITSTFWHAFIEK